MKGGFMFPPPVQQQQQNTMGRSPVDQSRLTSFLRTDNSFLSPWSWNANAPNPSSSNTGENSTSMKLQPGSFFSHEVGLNADHSYARSLALFAATLGPVAWKVASSRIEQALPVGFKFGRGWVGEYEPLPTPVLMLENHTLKQPAYSPNLQCTAESRKDGKAAEGLQHLNLRTRNSMEVTECSVTPNPATEHPVGGPTLERKLGLFGFAGKPVVNAMYQQQNPLTMNFSKLLEMVSRNRNVVQSVPFKQQETNGIVAVNLPNGKTMSSGLDSNRVCSSSSDFISNQPSRAVNYFPHGNPEQGPSDPVQLMRMLAEKSQNQMKSSNNSMVDNTPQVMPSVPSSRRDDSSTAAARAWMSIGSTGFQPTESSSPPKVQSAAAALYNPAQEHWFPVIRVSGEAVFRHYG
ncbi:hypothetical protein HHK36_023846 [Tetracentron sinense]|uniref:Uncharacterized protein n=1 Tax=Tetracentron sinense TaxID=13715 RepID=A0A834YPI4_TETSI|nr:hypothetical protein HHK36_023846 [Tetracentron sinense]